MTGLDDVPVTVPRRLGEILREPGLLGAAAGGAARARLHARARRRCRSRPASSRSPRSACSPPPACRSSAATCCSPPRCSRCSAARACSAGCGWTATTRGGRAGPSSAASCSPRSRSPPPRPTGSATCAARWAPRREILADLHDIDPSRDPLPPGRGPEPPPGPARRAVDRPRRPRRSSPPSSSARAAASTSTRRASASLRNFTLDPRDPKRLTAAVPPGFEAVAANRHGCSTRGAGAACAARGRRGPRPSSAATPSSSAISGTVRSAPKRSAIASRSSALSRPAPADDLVAVLDARERVGEPPPRRRRALEGAPLGRRAARVVAQQVERDRVEPGLLASPARGRSRRRARSARSKVSASRSSARARSPVR